MESINRTLHVLMVTPRYFPYVGGVETHVHEVSKRLVAQGVHLTLLTTVTGSLTHQIPREETIEGIRVIRVPAWPAQRDYYLAPEIPRMIEQGHWDLVHCQGCHTFVPPLAMMAAKKAHIPYIITFHTGGHSSPLRSLIRDLQWRLQRPLFAGAAHLIGVSRFEADYFRQTLQLPAEQFTVIPNGSLTVPPQDEETSATPSLIISIGRLERYKGHQRVIAALPHIRSQRPDARLLILGSGPYEAALRKLISQLGLEHCVEIRSIPASERQTMARVLSQAHLVALLSDYEAHPIAVMEALALRRPVLVTHTSGLGELAEQHLVTSVPLQSTPTEVARAALTLLDHPSPVADITLPTWEDCTEALLKIYHKTAKGSLCVF